MRFFQKVRASPALAVQWTWQSKKIRIHGAANDKKVKDFVETWRKLKLNFRKILRGLNFFKNNYYLICLDLNRFKIIKINKIIKSKNVQIS